LREGGKAGRRRRRALSLSSKEEFNFMRFAII
jgi:hypothetical protein